MGKRGPAKEPTAIKVAKGNPGKRGINREEPAPARVKNAKPPRNLTKAAKRVWRREAARLQALGVLTEADLNAFAQYCDVLTRWEQARDFLDKNGFVYAIYHDMTPEEKATGKKPRLKYMAQFPHVNIYSQLGKQLLQLAAQFGMTPSSRSALRVNPAPENEQDAWKKFSEMTRRLNKGGKS